MQSCMSASGPTAALPWIPSNRRGPLGNLGNPSTREPGATSGCRMDCPDKGSRKGDDLEPEDGGWVSLDGALPGWDAAGEGLVEMLAWVYEIVQAPRSADPSADGLRKSC